MEEGARFFAAMSKFNSPRIAIENPIQHRYAKEAHGLGDQTQTIQPWMFGHMEQKATCLWLKGIPKLRPTQNVKEEMLSLPKPEREDSLPTPRAGSVEVEINDLQGNSRGYG